MSPRALLLSACALLSACRPAAPLERPPPFDFDSIASPKPGDFSSDADLLSRWNDPRADSLRDFWSSGEGGSFAGVDGVQVAYRVHRAVNAKAGVVLLPGRTEAIIKYAEVVEDLVKQGYSTYALTLRGQGEAARMLPDPDKGHVAFFDDYVSDTQQFLERVVRPEQQRVFVVAHSTGGGVVPLLLARAPGLVDAVALSSPLLDVNLGAFPPSVAASLAAGACSATDGSGWAIGSGPYREETDFPNNTVTSSEPRWRWKVQQLRDDASIRLGGLTWRWLCQTLDGTSRAQALGEQNLVPTLLLQAEQDSFVNRAGQERYCADAPRCTFSRVTEAKHELLQERDEVRGLVLSRIVKFFDAQVTP